MPSTTPAADLVGLIPAAGQARRLGALPMSKELLPVAIVDAPGGPGVRVAAHGLLELMATAGARRAYVVLRSGKEDVARFLGRDGGVGVPLAFLFLPESPSLPASLDAAYPFVRGQRVALGFPDVQLGPADALARVAGRQVETGADLVLRLVEPARPSTTDMVKIGEEDRVMRIEVRPVRTELRWCWIVAVWGPRFTEHLHGWITDGRRQAPPLRPEVEPQIGDVVASALDSGLDVRGVPLPGGWYRDLGTPAELRAAWQNPAP